MVMSERRSFQVVHTTEYHYADPVLGSWQLARLTPRQLPWQHVHQQHLDIDPVPNVLETALDYFGNTVTRFSLQGAHLGLCVRAISHVTVLPHAPLLSVFSPAWEEVREGLRSVRFVNEAQSFTLASPLCPLENALRDYAQPSFSSGRPWLGAVHELMQRIRHDFVFDPQATTVTTPVLEVLKRRRGVCQDFAHLMIACLRSLGLPARYMSGYIQTFSGAGEARLQGADASHAWVGAYCPALGWVEFDPTNAKLADTEFVTLAWGRDFSEATPLRGVILGGGAQTLKVAVSVKQVGDF